MEIRQQEAITWNPSVKLVLSDVDETIADLYTAATPKMIDSLTRVLDNGVRLFFITGQSFHSVSWRIIDLLPPHLRRNILVGACNGAEVWGFDDEGNKLDEPYYSLYDDMMDDGQKKSWRDIVQQLIVEYQLETHATTPLPHFMETAGNNPLAIMMEDRGPQITFEMVNAYDLTEDQVYTLSEKDIIIPKVHDAYDLRQAIMQRATDLLEAHSLPVTPRLGGVFALDFSLQGVNKTTSIQHVLDNEHILTRLGLTADDLRHPEFLEIWGDKFSVVGGSDRHMSEAVHPKVRSIDFRTENPDEFPRGYNIVLWSGNHHLHEGTLEYLQSR